MPCAEGVRCKLPGQTPGPPSYTIYKCRKCWVHLHGICEEKDPIEDDACKRVCERHVRKRGAKTRGHQSITPKTAASLVIAVTPLAEGLVHPRRRLWRVRNVQLQALT
ncbi:unnamed protein product [Ascophyllum nodosum]